MFRILKKKKDVSVQRAYECKIIYREKRRILKGKQFVMLEGYKTVRYQCRESVGMQTCAERRIIMKEKQFMSRRLKKKKKAEDDET